jgi:hypothetical protein
MKSKEEIEQLSFKSYGDTLLKGSFIHGYTQCQEDMADVMEDFLEYVRDNYTGFGAPHLVHNKGGQRKTKAIVEDFINSLNKQD